MREHDILVLGGGTGNIVASAAADAGLDVGLVERDRLGGTCLNRGCNPTKKLIHRADVAGTVRNAGSVGVEATVEGIDFTGIVEEVIETVTEEAEEKALAARRHENVSFYRAEGRFVDDDTVEVDGDKGGTRLTADRIVLAGGSRPTVPEIDGIHATEFLTSDEALRLTEPPDRLVVVGGGYIAVELAHFFSQMGSDVVIVGRGEVLLDREDREVAEALTDVYRGKHELHLGYEATAVSEDGDERVVTAESDAGEELTVHGDTLLLATGRRPNTDQWNVDATEVDVDESGFVETDAHLETSVEGVYAMGDIAGNYMFKHSADSEAAYVVANAVEGREREVSYPGMAHAVFGSPQVGSLGRTESEIEGEYEVGRYDYDDTALGSALTEGGFAKVLVDPDGGILGCHIVGPEASTLIHEVSTAVAAGADAETVAETIHVHPALSEVVQGAFREVCDVAPSGF